MRYTKYNYNKKNKKENEIFKFIGSMILMAAFAIVVGISLAKFISSAIIENNSGDNVRVSENDNFIEANGNVVDNSSNGNSSNNDNVNNKDVNIDSTVVNSNFYTVQCGYFSEEANAKVALEKINKNYLPFIIKEDNKFRLLTMIGDSSKSTEIVNELKKNEIESIKINFMLDSKDLVQKQIAGICDGYLKIIDESMKSDVKFVETIKFKEWVSSLEVLEDGEESQVLRELKEYVNNMPEKIQKENVADAMVTIYDVLANFKIK